MLVILSTHLISEEPIIDRVLRPDNVFAIVPLRHPPVLNSPGGSKHGRPASLLDPLDMFPEIYECSENSSEESGRVRTLIPSRINLCQLISFIDQHTKRDLDMPDPPSFGA